MELKYDKQHIHERLPGVQPSESRCSSKVSGWSSHWLEPDGSGFPQESAWPLRFGHIAGSDAEALTLEERQVLKRGKGRSHDGGPRGAMQLAQGRPLALEDPRDEVRVDR